MTVVYRDVEPVASRKTVGKTRKGSPWLRGALVEAAWSAIRVKAGYFKAQYARLKGRRGPKKAIVAVAHSILVTVRSEIETQFRTVARHHNINQGSGRVSPISSLPVQQAVRIHLVVNGLGQQGCAQRGRTAQTQFGRALRELGIEWITAYSPQAKGRIEHLWGTFQDRLLKELRLEKIQNIPAANLYLQTKFLRRHNRQFRSPAAIDDPVYAPAPSPRFLDTILCWKEKRVLARDHTFSWNAQVWQVLPSAKLFGLSGKRIEVRKTLSGNIQAWYQGIPLSIRKAPSSPSLASHGSNGLSGRSLRSRARPTAAPSKLRKGKVRL